MTPETAAIVAFDVDEVLADVRASEAKRTPEEKERAALAIDRARFEAARFLLANGTPGDRQIAARFAFGVSRRAA